MQRFAESVAEQERSSAQAQGADVSSADDEQGPPTAVEDPIVRKQKQFHRAKLAMRRLRAQAERKRQSDAPIGNSLILINSALSLIRGGADVSLGWQAGSARAAGVLCFDEMQARCCAHLLGDTCSHGCSPASYGKMHAWECEVP
jgi:hypothetical protein